MSVELFNNALHQCIAFSNLVKGDGLQSNPFLILDNEQSIVLDRGGQLTFSALTQALRDYIDP